MARSTPRWLTSRNMLGVSVLALLLTSILPPRAGRALDWLSNPADFVLRPLQAVMVRGVNLVLGPDELRTREQATSAELLKERDEYLHQALQLQQENEDLRRVIIDLQQGMALNPSLTVRQRTAPVIGPSPDLSGGLLTLRAGKRDGVEVNSVVVCHGVHLVGRIRDVSERASKVLPITDRSAGIVGGVIMLDAMTAGPTCPSLKPTGDGRLRGGVEYLFDPAVQSQPEIKPHMTVRLLDKAWPESAQKLVIGEVESVDPDRGSPTRSIVTVRPLYTLDRLSEVMIRIPSDGDQR